MCVCMYVCVLNKCVLKTFAFSLIKPQLPAIFVLRAEALVAVNICQFDRARFIKCKTFKVVPRVLFHRDQ
ncbi:hypothetical protein NTE_00229 [Candidatus Nitrososphaera evergladensis SR1]|uniref:Uncharacterized protein n=1 Tax=Candidatus Nitrososphaera evergladensis SR1 TaxID=1459636 RepID=A0A075MLH5_9ARCH|nr:hypothetical protein NTE_00229 [Candidatus Nitrososphaera evergladensis SR1]